MKYALSAAIIAALILPATATAAFPGTNGRIAYQGYQSLGTINASGGDREPLIAEAGKIFSSPAWSSDGKRLAFSTNRDGNFEIYVTGAGGTPLTRLTVRPDHEDSAPSWSPDGNRIAFESEDASGRAQILVMNADGTGVQNLSPNLLDDRTPAWSPDGTRIAFAHGPLGGNHDIVTTAAAGGPATPLTTHALDEDNPDWSPDGARIAFDRGNDGSPATIVVMAADGSGQNPLPGEGFRPAWSPDGTKIVFDVEPELYTVSPDGSGRQQITSGGSPTLLSRSPSWQPIPIPAGGGSPPPPASIDADGDGVSPPLDCNDADPGVRPGARDIRGDKIDQDCVGGDAPAVIRRSIAGVTATYPVSGYTVFTSLSVKPVRRGDRLRLTCKGSGCAFKKKTIRIKKNAPKRSLMKLVGGMELRKGAVVQLRVTRAGTIGRVRTWNVRAPKIPKIADRCARPGAKKLIRCPRR